MTLFCWESPLLVLTVNQIILFHRFVSWQLRFFVTIAGRERRERRRAEEEERWGVSMMDREGRSLSLSLTRGSGGRGALRNRMMSLGDQSAGGWAGALLVTHLSSISFF
jgi:hypothetical protein